MSLQAFSRSSIFFWGEYSRWRLFSLMLIFSMAEASGTAVVTPNAVVVLPRTPDWYTHNNTHTETYRQYHGYGYKCTAQLPSDHVQPYLVLGQLFQAAVVGVQFLQTLVNWLPQWLQYALTQSSFYDALCMDTDMDYYFKRFLTFQQPR